MPRDIFVSKPNSLNREQQNFWSALQNMVKERGLRVRTIGETDFPNAPPMVAVSTVMNSCKGAIILGLRQIYISNGIEKGGTASESDIKDRYLPTAWNQIEAGMAFILHLPVLIIREAGIAGGVFDIGTSDRFVHQAELSDEWLHSARFIQPFNAWHEEVLTKN